MKTTKRFIMMTLAGVVGLSGAAVTALAVGGDDLVTLCFRNRTIQVPFYLINRYLAVLGTTTWSLHRLALIKTSGGFNI